MIEYQYLTAPAADSVILPAFNGEGTRWLSPTGAACRRILSYDCGQIWNWCQQNAINTTIAPLMLEQLAEHCGVAVGLVSTLAQEGSQLFQRFSSIGHDEQQRWLLADLSIRLAIQDIDLKQAKSPGFMVSQQPSDEAVMRRLHMNGGSIKALQEMLGQSPAQKTAEIQPTGANGCDATTSVPPIPVAQRMPLAQSSSNLPSRKDVAPATGDKRKREGPSGPSSFLPGSDSDDENALEEQAAGLQAKIASIRARTAEEDISMPRQKARKAKLQDRSAASVGSASHLPNQQPTAPAHPLVQSNMETELPPVTATNSVAVSSSNGIKLVLKRQGKPDYRCKASVVSMRMP